MNHFKLFMAQGCKRIFLVLWLISFSNSWVCAQEMPDVIPLAPEAASLGKYTDMPISYSSGLPQISIPMFTVSSRDISTSVSLSYHAGGIRVEEIASRVGLGWNLVAGGSITRIVKGIADDAPYGWLNPAYTIADFEQAPNTTTGTDSKYSIAVAAIGGNNDFEPDIFNANYNGRSISFYFNENGEIRTVTETEAQISYQLGGTNLGGISSFIITDTNGYQYHFGKYGNAEGLDYTMVTQSFVEDGTGAGLQTPADQTYVQYNAWHLMAIISPASDAQVTFNYTTQNTTSLNRGRESKLFDLVTHPSGGCPSPYSRRMSYSMSENVEAAIQSINFENGRIVFGYNSTERLDLPGGRALSAISQLDNDLNVLRRFDLIQSYWQSFDHVSVVSPLPGVSKNHLTQRLNLQKVVETGENGSNAREYSFTYSELVGLPNRFSFAQDVWGFYNGQNQNTTLIPTHLERSDPTVSVTPTGELLTHIPGADRRVSEVHTNAYSLERITYPTGGSASFSFEANAIYNASPRFTGTYFGVQEDLLAQYSYNQTNGTAQINFSVTDEHVDGMLRFNFDQTGCQANQTITGGILSCGINATLVGVTNPGYQRGLSLQDDAYFSVAPGDYRLLINISDPASVTFAWATIRGFRNPSPYADRNELQIGGQRVYRVTLDNGLGQHIIKEYSYVSNERGSQPVDFGSSGRQSTQKWVFFQKGVPYCENITNTATQQTSVSPLAAAGTGAGHVSYTKVIESQVPDSGQSLPDHSGTTFDNGFTVYEFDYAYDQPHDATEIFPYVPYQQYDWMRGNMRKQAIYKNVTGNLVQAKLDSSWWQYTDPRDTVRALKVDRLGGYIGYAYYNVWAGGNQKTRQSTTITENGQKISEVTDYEYNNHYLRPDRIIENHSDGTRTITRTKYADDVFGSELTSLQKSVLTQMVTDNRLQPILTETFANTENTPLSKNLTVYGDNGPRQVPVSQKFWNRDNATFEERLTFSYDAKGNYETITKDGDELRSYIWGHNGTLPIAEITGPAGNNANAYSSFETSDKGGWQYTGTVSVGTNVPTGKTYYNLTSSTSVSYHQLDASQTYVVSFLAKDGTPQVTSVVSHRDANSVLPGGWRYYEKLVKGNAVTIIGTAKIDELRLYPLGSHMTTMTYDKGQLSSLTGANGFTTYFVYDELGRLSSVKDKDGNLLEHYKYIFGQTASQTND